MDRKASVTCDSKLIAEHAKIHFFTETIDVGPISPLAFFEAGYSYNRNERFYWQNADRTKTLVGIGHAVVLSAEQGDRRFDKISKGWNVLKECVIKEEKDIDPVLFGGFSFDDKNSMDSEWRSFPAAYFTVPSFQLQIKNGETKIAINLVTNTNQADSAELFDKLRDERDRLIHIAQVEDFPVCAKPAHPVMKEQKKAAYFEAVQNATAKIKQGDAEKVVIARSIQLQFEEEVPAISALQHVVNEQQESYQFGLQKDDQFFFGATPERLIQIEGGRAYSACVAGSIKRGKSAEEDRELGKELLSDPKNREEHQYVVQMISDVFHSLCAEVTVPSVPKLMKTRDIQHLFTPVSGMMRKNVDIFDLVEALHPTPALGGTPRETAMDIIRNVEEMDRGYYAAPIGWVDTEGNGEFAVAIRSGLLENDKAYLYAGGGIVADSKPAEEYEETWVKFRPILRALGGKLNG